MLDNMPMYVKTIFRMTSDHT